MKIWEERRKVVTKSHPRLNDPEKEMSSRSARNAKRIAKLLHGPVRCPYCGKPAHTIAIDLESKQAEAYCQKCGTFQTPARKLKLFRR